MISGLVSLALDIGAPPHSWSNWLLVKPADGKTRLAVPVQHVKAFTAPQYPSPRVRAEVSTGLRRVATKFCARYSPSPYEGGRN
jgi:hypothetical protein